MLVGIIKEKNNTYYINLENQNNNKYISIVHTNKNNINTLTKTECQNLIKELFSSILRYKEKYNEYDVYLDAANNKRYYKNGLEDLSLFFNNNGKNAILYNEKNEDSSSQIKRFVLINKNKILFELIVSTLFISLTTSNIIFYGDGKPIFYDDLNLSSMEELINNSYHLTEREKEFLYNEDLFRCVLQVANNNRNFELRNKLNDIEIVNFERRGTHENANGYYNEFNSNCIYICNEMMVNPIGYYETLAHEFIHLLQDNNKYYYVREACAEILSTEFYNREESAYLEQCKRVKVLMEIIGPQPILECNFSGDTTSFENAIGEYLNNDEKDRFLSLLTTSSDDWSNNEENINNEIDSLLATMYYNKTGNNIEDDIMIRLLYISNAPNRIYFNSNMEEYYEDYLLNTEREYLGELDINEVINSNEVERYIWNKIDLTDSINSIAVNRVETTDFSSITLQPNESVEIEFRDGSNGHLTYDFVNNAWNTVEHYRITRNYEPSINNKFPEQYLQVMINESTNINSMEENESEVKLT